MRKHDEVYGTGQPTRVGTPLRTYCGLAYFALLATTLVVALIMIFHESKVDPTHVETTESPHSEEVEVRLESWDNLAGLPCKNLWKGFDQWRDVTDTIPFVFSHCVCEHGRVVGVDLELPEF